MYRKPINITTKKWSAAKSVLHYSTLLHKTNMYINQKNEIILRVYPIDNPYLPIIYKKAGTTRLVYTTEVSTVLLSSTFC